jgi:tRNA (5-methylaminomethyl-2-thiouridylate)-methyltransferase
MKTAVLLSGGVDSSVALSLLADQGHDLHAFYLKVWLEDEVAYVGDCPWEEDLHFVRAVCEQFNVPLTIVPLQAEYLDRVVGHALYELRSGRTPSPDIFCNERIKFGAFFDRIDDSFGKVASGHHAQVECENGSWLLKRGADPIKDQTYFLSNLHQDQLAKTLFPIGHLEKTQVREIADQLELPNRARKDSQGICFLGKIRYRDFIQFHLGTRPGNIVDQTTSQKLGTHEGFWFYTIGQRFGLGLSGGPWYVASKDTDGNVVYVVHRDQLQYNRCSSFSVRDINWISGLPNSDQLQVRIRHAPELPGCTVHRSPSNDSLDVELAEPDAGVASGQHAVFYNTETCLGGGIIERG